jgi:hypothetical protein
MGVSEMKWSKTEKEVARRAFDTAYRSECNSIAAKLKEMIEVASRPSDVWHIHDYLTEQSKLTDAKYDYRYSVIIFVFSRLLREGWINEDDLEGLQWRVQCRPHQSHCSDVTFFKRAVIGQDVS